MDKKKMLKHVVYTVLLCMMFILFFDGRESQAKRLLKKSKSLQPGKTYSLDIDGDKKKESVQFLSKRNSDDLTVSTLYVDGKKYYQWKAKSADYDHQVDLCDLYAKKKGMNLVMYEVGSSECIGKVRVLQCGKKKGKSIASMSAGVKGKMDFVRFKGKTIQGKEEGTFTLNVDTPFYLNYFGCYYSKIKWQIKGKKIQPIVQTDYAYNMKYTFTLRKSIIAYDIPDSVNGDPSVVDANTKLSVLAVRPVEYDEQSGNRTNYVKIKTDTAILWVYDEPIETRDATSYYFKEIPSWG